MAKEIEPEKEKIYSKVKIKQDSIFSFEELYKIMYRWYETKGYSLSEVEYRKYGTGDFLEIIWTAEKTIDHYAKIIIDMDLLATGLEKVEIDVEGVKSKSNKCSIEMKFDVTLILDYKAKFGPLMRKIYHIFLIKKRIEDYETKAASDANGLFSEIKAFLKLHQF